MTRQIDEKVERLCQWFDCDKKADVYIRRASTYVCQEHLETNILRFGCAFETEPVNQSKEQK